MRTGLLTTLLALTLLGGAFAEPEIKTVPAPASGPPVRLTASDGTGLHLVEYRADVVVQGPLAFTQLHLTFQNPQDRVLEGRFEITLPEGAALSRLAMKNPQGWMEAEVVELQKARQAYEDFLHRKQDPALMEKQAGNQFQARVFPIAAKSKKELILSYSQELAGEAAYRLPTAGLPKVDNLSVRAHVWQGAQKPQAHLKLSLHGEAPRGDLQIAPLVPIPGLVNGDEVLVSVKAAGKAAAPAPDANLLVLVDTSASRAAGYQAQLKTLRALLEDYGRRHPGSKVRVAAFDQSVQEVSDLSQREPLGATNLRAALRWASRQKGFSRLLVVTDGVATAGEEGPLQLSGFTRVDALLTGGIRETQDLEPLVYGAPQSGFLLDGERPVAEICEKFSTQPLSGLKVSIPGADWVWPPVLNGVAPGEDRLVYAHMRQPGQKIAVKLGGQTVSVPLSSASQPLLHRAVVGANLQRLSRQWRRAQGSQKESLARHIVELSTGNRVVSDLTGLLVLETEEDYRRFDIDRRALKDILVVTDQGLEVKGRKEAVVAAAAKTPVLTKDKTANGSTMAGESVSQPAPADGPAGYVADSVESAAPAARPMSPRPPMSVRMPMPQAAAGAPRGRSSAPAERRRANGGAGQSEREIAREADEPEEKQSGVPALSGTFLRIDRLLQKGAAPTALQMARQWHRKNPGDVLALVALGKSLKECGQPEEAARAYGSIIDLYPGRADLRRYAGCLLETVHAETLACDSFAKAAQQRPDHPSSHRMKAYALVKLGRLQEAFDTLVKARKLDYPGGRFAGVQEVLNDDLGIVAAALVRKNPDLKARVVKQLHELGVPMAQKPSLRFVLTWETDANDVDFHIRDGKGGHAYYSSPELPSGGRLYADVTTGYGPECFQIPGRGEASPYRISIHYYSRGPMGYGMGKIEILRHDGEGKLSFEERPFVVMNDSAYVDLGLVK